MYARIINLILPYEFDQVALLSHNRYVFTCDSCVQNTMATIQCNYISVQCYK